MRIVYRISEQDYLAARDLFVANERPVYRRISRRLMPWIGGFLLVTQVAYAAIVPRANPALTAFGALVGIYFLYCGFALRRYFRRSYRKDRRFEHDFTADVSDDGIHIVTTTAEAEVKWAGFVRFLESDEIFMLFHAEWIFNIFPKRAFAPGEADRFRELLRHNIHAQ
jgi:hypothetical protein